MPTTPPEALVRALELEGGSPTRSPRARSPDAASAPSSPASAYSARSESARRALSPTASISKMAGGFTSADDWERDDEWRSPARASPSTARRRRADGLEAISSSDEDDDDARSPDRASSAFHTPAAHLLNATPSASSSRCNTGKSSALGRGADDWLREARERIADLDPSSPSPPNRSRTSDRSVSISPGGLPATPTRTSPSARVDAATKVSRDVDAMLVRAAAAAEATAAATADRSSYLARTVARRSPAAAERAGRDAELAREATARRLEVEAAAAEAEARRMLAEAARKREEAAAAEAAAAEAEAAAERSPQSTRMEDTSRSSLDGALDVTTVSAGEIEAAMENKETVSLLRAAGGYSKVSAGTPPPTTPGPYPTSWEDALNDILASIPQPLVSPIEKAIMSPVEDDYYGERPASASGREAKEEKAKEEKAKEGKQAKEEKQVKEEEDAVTPTTGQILEISARERAVQTELEILDDRYRTVVASRRRELLEATLAERDAVAEELARREALERAETAFRAFHSPSGGGGVGVGDGDGGPSSPPPPTRSSFPVVTSAAPSPSKPSPGRTRGAPAQPSPGGGHAKDERPPWTDGFARSSPARSSPVPTPRTFLRRGTGSGGAPVTGNVHRAKTPSTTTTQATTPETREESIRREFAASVERERSARRARSTSRTPSRAGPGSGRRSMSKSPARVRTTPSHPTPDYSAIESRYAAAARARSTAAPWRGSPPTPSWRPNGYNNPRVDDRGATPSPEPRRSVTPEPRRRAPPRATPVKPSSATTPAAAGIEPSTSSGSPMRFRSTPEGKNGATPSAAYVEAAENMRRSLRRLGAASEAADLVLMRSAAAVVAAEETKKAADRGGVEATFIDAFRKSAEKKGAGHGTDRPAGEDARPAGEDAAARVKTSSPRSSPEPANDFERQFLAAYRKYASSPSPVAARDSAAKKPAPVERTPPSARANEPSRTSGETPRNAEKRREATSSEARPGAGAGAGGARPGSSSAEAARLRASLARLNAATVAKDGEYHPPPPPTTTTDVDGSTESPAVRLFSEKMSAPSPEKRRAGATTPERAVARTPAAIAPDSDEDDDRLLGLDENADIRRFLGTPRGAPPGGKRREATGAPLASLGANASTSRGAEERAEDAKTLLPAPVAKTRQLDKDKRKREDREADDFEALLASHDTERVSGSHQPARARSSIETKAHVTARRPPVTKPAPAPVSRTRGRSSLLTKPPAASAVERPPPSSATTFQERTRGAFGLAPGSVLSRSRAEYEAEKAAKARREAEECTFSPKTIGTPAYLKKKRAAGAGSGKKREVRYAELPIRGSAWR